MGDRRHLWGLCYRPLGAKEEGSDALCWMSRLFRPFPRKSERNCLKKKKKKTHTKVHPSLCKVHIFGGGEKSRPGLFCSERRRRWWEEERGTELD